MKSHNYQVSGKQIFEQMHRIPDKNPGENPTGIEFRNMHHINMPCYEMLEVWFEDMDDRFWHLDLATNTLTELKPRDVGPEEPIPSEVWPAFGTLLGILVLRKERATKMNDAA